MRDYRINATLNEVHQSARERIFREKAVGRLVCMGLNSPPERRITERYRFLRKSGTGRVLSGKKSAFPHLQDATMPVSPNSPMKPCVVRMLDKPEIVNYLWMELYKLCTASSTLFHNLTLLNESGMFEFIPRVGRVKADSHRSPNGQFHTISSAT